MRRGVILYGRSWIEARSPMKCYIFAACIGASKKSRGLYQNYGLSLNITINSLFSDIFLVLNTTHLSFYENIP